MKWIERDSVEYAGAAATNDDAPILVERLDAVDASGTILATLLKDADGNTSLEIAGDSVYPPPGGGGSETTSTLGTLINNATAKPTPVDADNVAVTDSTSSHIVRKTTWANVKATLKTYFDTLYNLYTHPNHSGEVTSTGDGAQVLDKTAVTNRTLVSAAVGDHVLISDVSDTDNLKKVTVQTIVDLAAGGGDVTASGTLTANSVMLGNGTTSVKAIAGMTTDGTSKVILGVAGASVGALDFKNATSGTLNLAPQTGDLATSNLVLPAVSGTLTVNDAAQVLTNKTLDADSNTITNIAKTKVDADTTLPATCIKGEIVTLSDGRFYHGEGTNDWDQVLKASNIGGVRAVTGTTDTVLSTDFSKMVTYSNASSIAVTLPQAGSGSPASFLSGWFVGIQNLGAGTVTITPTTSTINGGATLVLLSGQFASVYSDGANYVANMPVNKVNGLTVTNSSGTLTVTNGKTASFSNSVTFAGTDSTTMTCPGETASLGYLNIPQNSKSAAYTTVLLDAGKHILHPSTDDNARTFTIDSNANVAYPVGTTLTFINEINTVTIAITSDTLTLAGAGTTGSRTLAANGIATAVKVASTKWIINGTGLT